MNLRDFALEIEPEASAERRHNIEQILHRAVAEYLIRAAIEVDEEARQGRIHHAYQAAALCREQAHDHLNQT